MTALCQNCRHAVPQGAAFCPECGAPQLRVPSQEAREAEQQGDAPAPRHIGDIAWPAAVQSAALYAVPAGLLLFVLPLPIIRMLWVVAGAVWTLRRYARLAPRAPALTPQLGGRIGLVLGLFAAVVSTAADAVTFLVERYTLHQGSSIDGPYESQMREALTRATQLNPDAAEQSHRMLGFLLSPEGVGTVRLLTVAASAISVLFFAWLAGRFSVRYGAGRRRS